MMKYSKQWTANLSSDDKKFFEEMLGVNNKVLDRLVKICYNMLSESEKTSDDYTNPNWALRQADLVGYRRGLQRVIKLCTPSPERDHA